MAADAQLIAANRRLQQQRAKGVTDFSKMLDPAIEVLNQKTAQRVERTTSAITGFLENKPDDFSAESVPPEARAGLREYLAEQSSMFAKYSNIAGKNTSDPDSQEYKDAITGMETIKQNYASTKTFVDRLAEKRTKASNSIEDWSPSLTNSNRNVANELVGGTYYDSIDWGSQTYTNYLGEVSDANNFELPSVRISDKAVKSFLNGYEDAVKMGEDGEKFELDENGNPANAKSRIVYSSVTSLTKNKSVASDIFFGGVPGFSDAGSIPVNAYLQEKEIDTSDPVEYNISIEDLKHNFPTEWLDKYMLEIFQDANTEGLDSIDEDEEKTESLSAAQQAKADTFVSSFNDSESGAIPTVDGKIYKRILGGKYQMLDRTGKIVEDLEPINRNTLIAISGIPQEMKSKLLEESAFKKKVQLP